MEIFERAKGKINLTLDITGESGGFHLLDMLVATIDLFDDVKITYRADDKIECVQDGEIAERDASSAYKW
jgi:4-diphosphocytidyl-2C-methyl-D-erythritol kinase